MQAGIGDAATGGVVDNCLLFNLSGRTIATISIKLKNAKGHLHYA